MMRMVLLGLILLVLAGCGESTESATTSATIPVEAPPITVNGRVVPYSVVDVGFPISGQIAEWLVEPGAMVTKGQELARLDPHTLQLQVSEAEANLKRAEATLERVRVTASDTQQKIHELTATPVVEKATKADAEQPTPTPVPPTPTPNAVAGSEIREAEAAIALARIKLDRPSSSTNSAPSLRRSRASSGSAMPS